VIGRILLASHVEGIRALRSWQTYGGPLAVLLAVAAALWVHPVARDGVGDYAFAAYAAPAALNLLGFLFVLVFSASLVAPDLAGGNLRMVVVRPVRRTELLAGKLLVALAYALCLTVLAATAAWALAWFVGDMQGVTFGGELLFTSREMLFAYLAAAALGLAPHFAGAGLGLFFSTCTRSQTGAVMLTLGTWFAVDLCKYPFGIERYVFTTYLESPWQVVVQRADGFDAPWFPMAAYSLAASASVLILAALGAAVVFRYRDLGR